MTQTASCKAQPVHGTKCMQGLVTLEVKSDTSMRLLVLIRKRKSDPERRHSRVRGQKRGTVGKRQQKHPIAADLHILLHMIVCMIVPGLCIHSANGSCPSFSAQDPQRQHWQDSEIVIAART